MCGNVRKHDLLGHIEVNPDQHLGLGRTSRFRLFCLSIASKEVSFSTSMAHPLVPHVHFLQRHLAHRLTKQDKIAGYAWPKLLQTWLSSHREIWRKSLGCPELSKFQASDHLNPSSRARGLQTYPQSLDGVGLSRKIRKIPKARRSWKCWSMASRHLENK